MEKRERLKMIAQQVLNEITSIPDDELLKQLEEAPLGPVGSFFLTLDSFHDLDICKFSIDAWSENNTDNFRESLMSSRLSGSKTVTAGEWFLLQSQWNAPSTHTDLDFDLAA